MLCCPPAPAQFDPGGAGKERRRGHDGHWVQYLNARKTKATCCRNKRASVCSFAASAILFVREICALRSRRFERCVRAWEMSAYFCVSGKRIGQSVPDVHRALYLLLKKGVRARRCLNVVFNSLGNMARVSSARARIRLQETVWSQQH